MIVTNSTWTAVAASVTGVTHEAEGLPCQDRVWVKAARDDVIIAIISDGAGSASRGEHGAELVVKKFGDVLLQVDWSDQMTKDDYLEIIGGALTELEALVWDAASTEGAAVDDYLATVTGFVVSPNHTAAFQVGDGFVVCRETHSEVFVTVIPPKQGEYVNSTFFATAPGAVANLQVWLADTCPAFIAASSDGLASVSLHCKDATPGQDLFGWYERNLPWSESPEVLFRRLESLLTNAPEITARVTDDRCLVICKRTSLI